MGDMLKISSGELQAIQTDLTNGGDSRSFFRAVLIKWEETRHRPYTWQTMLDVLSSPYIDQAPLARDIEHQLMTTGNVGDTVKPPTEGSGDVPEGNFRAHGPHALDMTPCTPYVMAS